MSPKTFNIISNNTNGAGLERDFKLLRGMLESYGCTVYGHMFNDLTMPRRTDVSIYLEVIAGHTLNQARENWLIPNSEWYFANLWDQFLPKISRVLCKTKDCLDIWTKKVGNKATYIGFESNDFLRPDIQRRPHFLHMAGKSETKNTQAVTDAWRQYKLPYPLTLVAFKPNIVQMCRNIPYATHITRLTDEQVITFMNEHLFHIMPSKYEGFGHFLHEALGTGGIVVTTNAPPMNTFPGIPKELLIPVSKVVPMRAAVFNEVTPLHVAEAVHRAAALSPEKIRELSDQARAGFLSDREFFRATFETLAKGNL